MLMGTCSRSFEPTTSNHPDRGLMRPLRYSINVTLDGCCDHRVMIADEELHHHATKNLEQADAFIFGRVTYELMEAGWRRAPPTLVRRLPSG